MVSVQVSLVLTIESNLIVFILTSGSPSEKNLYADIDAAWQSLRSRYGISPEHVIIYGQSIGTGKHRHVFHSDCNHSFLLFHS